MKADISGNLITRAIMLSAIVHLILPGTAQAGDGQRYDRNIERAAARIAAEKLGDLRGSFSHDVKVDTVTVEISSAQKEPELPPRKMPITPPPDISRRDFPGKILQRESDLPPIVEDNTDWGNFGVDPVMTGGTERLTWLSAGDVEFAPPAAPPLSH